MESRRCVGVPKIYKMWTVRQSLRLFDWLRSLHTIYYISDTKPRISFVPVAEQSQPAMRNLRALSDAVGGAGVGAECFYGPMATEPSCL